jgi:AcrR family transcriptional regulator
MQDEKIDRRVQRTRQMLRGALVQLIKEKGYDMVTIQDITERANLGRTTFYLHYQTKEDLLFDHHAEMSAHFSLSIFTRDELLGDTPQPQLIKFLQLLTENRPMYHTIRAAKDSAFLLRGIREQIVSNLQDSLEAIFPNIEPKIPLDVLTTYIIGAQLSLIQWWMTTHTPHNAVQIATMLHHLQQTAICDAYQLQ